MVLRFTTYDHWPSMLYPFLKKEIVYNVRFVNTAVLKKVVLGLNKFMTKKATWLQSKNWRLILQQFMKDGHCELCHLWSYFFKQSQYEKLYCISSWEEKNNSDVVIATKVFLKSKSQRFIYYCYSSILPGCLKALIWSLDSLPPSVNTFINLGFSRLY